MKYKEYKANDFRFNKGDLLFYNKKKYPTFIVLDISEKPIGFYFLYNIREGTIVNHSIEFINGNSEL